VKAAHTSDCVVSVTGAINNNNNNNNNNNKHEGKK
jgi:hypothetical protein